MLWIHCCLLVSNACFVLIDLSTTSRQKVQNVRKSCNYSLHLKCGDIKVIFFLPLKKNLKVRYTGRAQQERCKLFFIALPCVSDFFKCNFYIRKKNPIRDVTVLRPMGVCDIWYEIMKSIIPSPLCVPSNVLWNAQVFPVLLSYNNALALLSVCIDFRTKTIYSRGKCYYFNIRALLIWFFWYISYRMLEGLFSPLVLKFTPV